MSKFVVLVGVLLWLLLPTVVRATPPALEGETKTESEAVQETQASPQPTPTPSPRVVRPQPTSEPPVREEVSDQTANQWQPLIEAVQNRLQVLEAQAQQPAADDQSVAKWLNSWWQVGFWGGVLLLFPWIFVGWQWTRRRFWGFGWPWPWWFWIPLWWFWPWLFIGWWGWLDWWEWWGWLWWLWPWLFWLFWWVILFKELMISHWHRRGPEFKETGGR